MTQQTQPWGAAQAFGGQPPPEQERPATPPGYTRRKDIIRIPLKQPKYNGGREFYGDVAKPNATFAPAELCVTGSPEYSLAPVPEVAMKTWYNTYLYVPEEKSHLEEQFLERFVQGPDGEWLDVVRARRLSGFLEEERRREENDILERKAVMSGLRQMGPSAGAPPDGRGGVAGASSSCVSGTQYRCSYSGEPLVSYRGELKTREELMEQFKINESLKDMIVEEVVGGDFDNLRIPWPFGRPFRNKMISQHSYEWFDRRNPFIPDDRSYQMLELPSSFVDKDNYAKWRTSNSDSPIDAISDACNRTRYIDDYPYRI